MPTIDARHVEGLRQAHGGMGTILCFGRSPDPSQRPPPVVDSRRVRFAHTMRAPSAGISRREGGIRRRRPASSPRFRPRWSAAGSS